MRHRTTSRLTAGSIIAVASACASPVAITTAARPLAGTAQTPLPAAADLPRPKRLWHTNDLRLRTSGRAAVSSEALFSEYDGIVSATDITTGRPLWTRSVDAVWVALIGGRLLVQADALMALDSSNGATLWTSPTGCAVVQRNLFVERDVAIGSFNCGPADYEMGVHNEDAYETQVLSLRDGKLIRRSPKTMGPLRLYDGVSHGRAIARRYHGLKGAGEPSFSIEALDVITGNGIWKVEMRGAFDAGGVIGDVVILSGRRTVGVDASNGRTLWVSEVNDQQPTHEFRVMDGRLIRVTHSAVQAIDPTTGRVAVSFEMPTLDAALVGRRGVFVDDIVVGNGRVTASLEEYLVTWDSTGRRAFQSPLEPYGLGAVVGDVVLGRVRSEPGVNPGVTAFSLRETEKPLEAGQ